MDSLTYDQQRRLASFQEISQVDDVSRAVNILRAYDWDVDRAVDNYLSGNYREETSSTNQGEEVWRNVEENAANMNESWLSNAIFSPFKWIFSTRPVIINPDADARYFLNDFNQKFGFQHPTFQVCSYQQSVAQAFRQHKLLITYIHSPLHEDTNAFCSDVLCTQNVSRTIDEHAFFWSGSVWSTEAYGLSIQLKASCFPFLAILICQSERTVQVIDKIHGILEQDAFLEKLNNAINVANPFVTRLRTEQRRREEATQLREQQDREYKEAEEADRKERLRKEQEKARKEQEERELLRLERERQEQEEAREAAELLRKQQYQLIIQEKQMKLLSEPKEGPDVALIRFQLPQSTKLTRRFLKTDTVETLYDYILIHFYTIGSQICNISLATHSKQELTDRNATVESVGLHPRGMLYVTDLDA